MLVRRCTVPTAALLVLAFCASAAAIRGAPASGYISLGPSAAGGWFGGGSFAFSGGVSPNAKGVIFFDQSGRTISTGDLTIIYARNSGKDYVAIRTGSQAFDLPMPHGMACPLARFVARNGSIAFTIPEITDDSFFSKNGLVKYKNSNALVAREFSNTRFADFLKDLDLDTTITVPLQSNLRNGIMNEINSANGTSAAYAPRSYVNADFHVTYSAYLDTKNGRNIVDIAGLPLRYYWAIASNGKAAITNVRIFSFPTTEDGLVYDAILFFQNAAVFKQINQEAKARFASFTSAACGKPAPVAPKNPARQ
jgi:hypothetical protein